MTDREPSFTERAICEAVGITRKNLCCGRAFAFGFILGAGEQRDKDNIFLRAKTAELSEYLQKLVRVQFGREAVVRCVSQKTGTYELSFISSRAADMINDAETAYEKTMKCSGCSGSFLCGLFCACASISDPKSGYYLSLRIPPEYKDTVSRTFVEADISASYRESGKKGVFYMRASGIIEDFLAVCGMQKLLFDFMNCKIEKEIRNNANRSSNIEYNNIQKSVGAAKKYIEAIDWLRENDRLTGLDSELHEAARLRAGNPECSLSTLGAMMTPPVSKSGVLHRLNRIYDIYIRALKKD